MNRILGLIAVSILGFLYISAYAEPAVGAGFASVGPPESGHLVAWGPGGQSSSPPVVASGHDFIAAAVGSDFGVALKSDGSLVAMGVGLGYANAPTGSGFAAIDAAGDTGLALKSDKSLVAWGDSSQGLTNIPSGQFTAISLGSFGLAVRSDGSLAAWGNDNWYGQLNVPSGHDFVAVSAGTSQGLALRSDGSLIAWGSNTVGEGTAPAGNNFIAISAGDSFNLALRSNGTLVGWGDNYNGQCLVPSGSDFIAVDAGFNHGVALRSNGSLAQWGYGGQTNMPLGNNFIAISAGMGMTNLAIQTPEPLTLLLLSLGGFYLVHRRNK